MKERFKPWNLLFLVILFCCMTASVSYAAIEQTRAVETVTVQIHYYFWDELAPNHQSEDKAINSFVANMPVHSPGMTERCPTVVGYVPCDQSGNELNPKSISFDFESDREFIVLYKSALVPYTISLYKQNLYDMDYTYAGSVNCTGRTDTVPVEFSDPTHTIPEFGNRTIEEVFDGFRMIYHQSDRIAADGSTEFWCYYDREQYHVYFDLGEGGYGVEPLYAAYETPLNPYTIGTPHRAGYDFDGWKWQDDEGVWHDGLEEKVTHEVTYVAKWEAHESVRCTVVYRYADALDDMDDPDEETEYLYWGRKTIRELNGDPIYPSDELELSDIVSAFSATAPLDEGEGEGGELPNFDYFTFDAEATTALNRAQTKNQDGHTIVVKGDGTTVITLYYKRRMYTMQYAYMRQPMRQERQKETNFDSSKQYVIARAKDGSAALTAQAYTSGGEQNTVLAQMTATGNIEWTFTPVTGQPGYYTISCTDPSDSKLKYLEFYVSASGNTRQVKVREFAAEETLPAYAVTYHSAYQCFSIGKQFNNEMYYLNDKGNAGTRASCYNQGADANEGSRWFFYCMADQGTFSLVPSGTYQITTRSTGSGIDAPGNVVVDGKTLTPVTWDRSITTPVDCPLPEASFSSDTLEEDDIPYDDLPEHQAVKGRFLRKVGDNYYIYYCVFLREEYDAFIEDIWPGSVVGSSGSYSFGSWGVEYGTAYREIYGNNGKCNIVGTYPYLSKELIKDPADPCAQTMYAWFGGTDANIAHHAFEIYYEVTDSSQTTAESITNGDGSVTYYELDRVEVFNCAHNDNTKILPFANRGFTVVETGFPVSHGDPHVYKSVTYTDALGQTATETMWTTKLHYNRNRHSLEFENLGEDYDPTQSGVPLDCSRIGYGVPLTPYRPDDPPYPSDLAEGCYEFAGWYRSNLYALMEKIEWGDETDPDGHILLDTMPDSNLALYALWEPRTFTVTYYSDLDSLEADTPESPTYVMKKGYVYDTKIPLSESESVEAMLERPSFETAAGTLYAEPAGWYYLTEDDRPYPFDPSTMTVQGDMKLFMRWSTTIPTDYTLHYYIKGTTQKVANDNAGHSFVGLTRTFNARTDTQLLPGYRTNWFPDRRSTSIIMYPDAADNTQTFYYMWREQVYYRVRYIGLNSDGTEEELFPEERKEGVSAIVTERFKVKENWVPKNYYISFILTVSQAGTPEEQQAEEYAQNVITFYYTENENHVPYHISYLHEVDPSEAELSRVIDGETCYFRKVSYIDSIAEKGETRTASISSYTGYLPVGIVEKWQLESEDDDVLHESAFTPLSPSDTSVSLTISEGMTGKELLIFYLRKTYPVRLVYTIHSSDPDVVQDWYEKITSDPTLTGLTPQADSAVTVTGPGGEETVYRTLYRVLPEESKYNDTVHADAPEGYDGYRLAGDPHRTLVIADDATPDCQKNRIVFEYSLQEDVMFYYQAVRPYESTLRVFENAANPKLLSFNQENAESGVRPSRRVQAVLRTDLYVFEGWFRDAACTDPVVNAASGDLTDIITGAQGEQFRPAPSNTDRTYYAKYDYIRGDLSITVEDCLESNQDQVFEYVITGTDEHNSWIRMKVLVQGNNTKVIKDLPIGHYSITQTTWSWRYTSDQTNQTVSAEVEEAEETEVTFRQTMTNTKWLDGNGLLAA